MLTLVITTPNAPARHLPIDPAAITNDGLVIGRSPRNAVVIDDPSVSRAHARLLLRDGALHIEDIGSSSGSMLNGVRLIPRTPMRLAPNDQVTFGLCTVEVHATAAANDHTTDTPTLMAVPPTHSYLPLADADLATLPTWKDNPVAVRVVQVTAETHDVKTFAFAAESPTLFHYLPGQFLTLHLTIDGKPVNRSYTISSSPTRPHLLTITVKRVPAAEGHTPGLVSNWLHDHLHVGDRLSLSGPFGDFTCARYPAPRLLLISGGSGITPMLSMARWLTDSAATADTVFLHGARSSQDLIAREELNVLAQHNPHLRLLFITSRPEPGSAWPGISGRITHELLALAVPDFAQRHVFCCGPEAFMRGIKELLTAAGFPMDHYHEESFGGAKKAAPAPVPPTTENATPAYGLAAILKGLPSQATGAKNQAVPTPPPKTAAAPSITCSRSKRTIPCPPSSSVLEALETAGIAWPSGCRMGKCGACKTKMTSGKLDLTGYDDAILKPTDRANGTILCCIAKPAGTIAIDA